MTFRSNGQPKNENFVEKSVTLLVSLTKEVKILKKKTTINFSEYLKLSSLKSSDDSKRLLL